MMLRTPGGRPASSAAIERREHPLDHVGEMSERCPDVHALGHGSYGAGFLDGQVDELIGAGDESVAVAPQRRLAFASGHPTPRTVVERSAGGEDRSFDVGDVPLGNGRKDLLGRGVDDVDLSAATAVSPLAVYVEPSIGQLSP